MQYVAPAWLRLGRRASAHLQTIVPATLSRRPRVPFRRERWPTPDDDFVDVDLVDAPRSDAPIVVLFHGLEGSSDSHYARALMHAVRARGWMGAVVHFRGCSGEPNHRYRAYHLADSDEIDWILHRFAHTNTARPLYAVGVSLGGNALAKWLGERAHAARFVTAAAVISAPLDVPSGGRALSRGFNMLYTRMFLRTLKKRALDKIARHRELDALRARLDAIRKARDLQVFDDLFTAPVHGFDGVDDYWRRASAKPWLMHIHVPTLVLNARNDPFLPADALPGAHEVSARVTLEQPDDGGHVGFATGAFPGRLDWLPNRVLHFFEQVTRG